MLAVHQSHQPGHQVVHVLEGPRLGPVAEHGQAEPPSTTPDPEVAETLRQGRRRPGRWLLVALGVLMLGDVLQLRGNGDAPPDGAAASESTPELLQTNALASEMEQYFAPDKHAAVFGA